ncbi:MAG TPA: carbamate kinase [Anaerolineaceae bacterium]|jgi:carbamate kinase|nr:carbamate kinase [Anaerolineaceae bacterium]NMD27477.1 carbamate kinase [Chloroflexota bacterium]HOA21240.1 carbamate kinase [Anaerolineaceae bacterium]HOG77324.1 carbamate kinase [Anaerolineaceae bacterium]
MEKKGLAVVAVGGNALIKDKNHQTVQDQYQAAADTMVHITTMIEEGWDVVVTHGNGPQVGFILRRSEIAAHELHEIPLDYCGADTQGAIGYMFQQALHNEFHKRGIQKSAATVVTQTIVDSEDPAFTHPTKPIGSFLDESQAKVKIEKDGWTMVEDAGRGWRRVVPSPIPQTIVEADAIRSLIDQGFVVVAVGGGGIPVMRTPEGNLVGVEAVIDKDFGSAILACMIQADLFLISTAVEKVAINFNKPDQKWLDRITVAEARQYLKEGHFAKGSMLPKIEAILKYMDCGGKTALITDPEHIKDALDGKTGTWILP